MSEARLRAAIYARRSTAEQGASIEGQVGQCERFITDRGWEVGSVYADTASGWKEHTPRPEFDAMMADAAAGVFDVLVVWEVSRLSRQEDDRSALSIVWRLRGHGVEVHSVIEPTTGVKLADDMSLLIKSHAAKEESDLKSRRVTRGKRQGVLAGVHQGANACYGYMKEGKIPHGNRSINRYVRDGATAPVVEEIVSSYLERRSPQEIAHALNARGIAPPDPGKRHRYQREGTPVWHQSVIRNLLSNPLLAGFAAYKGGRIKACACAALDDMKTWSAWDACEHEWVRSLNVPGIITPERWEDVQRVVASRSRPSVGGRGNRGSSSRFMLSGLVFCGECGERIGCRADKRRHSDTRRHTYICRGRRMGPCSLPIIEQAELDEAVRDHFVEHHVDAIDVAATIEHERERLLAMRQSETTVLREELAEAEAELVDAERFRARARADYAKGVMSGEQWSSLDADCAARANRARDAAQRMRERIEAIEDGISTRDVDRVLDLMNRLSRMISESLAAEDIPTLNAQLHEVFERFVISHDGGRIVVDPVLRREWLPGPEEDYTALDFGLLDPDAEGIQVTAFHADVAMRKIDLLAAAGADKITCSS